MGAAADAPEPSRAAAPSELHSRASCQRLSDRATSSLRSVLESGSNGGWSGHSESQMPQCRPARLAGSPPACDGAAVVLRGPVWPRLVRQHSELGADGRCKQQGYLRAWLRRKKLSCDLGRLHAAIAQWNRRPANFNFDRRSALCKRWPRRCDSFRAYCIQLHRHVNRRCDSTVARRVADAAQRTRTQMPPLVHHEPSAVTPRM